ncbi:hypothetical protein ACVWXQ_004297 [Bradyrhizobium sp. S3.14.4]
MEEYRARPELRDVKQFQSELALVPVAVRNHRVHREAVRRISSDIAEIFSDIVTKPIVAKRLHGKRAVILDAAIDWCAATYGKTIGRRRAQLCWDEFSAMMKRLQREGHMDDL